MRIERHVLLWLMAAGLFLLTIALLRPVLLPFVAGIVIAYFLNPIANRLERLGLNRMLSAAIIVAIGGVIVVVALMLLIPFLAVQFRSLAETLPGDLDRLRASMEFWLTQRLGDRLPMVKAGVERALADLARSWSSSAGAIAVALWSQGLALANLLSLLLVTPVVVFYLLVDWHPMLNRIDGWLPRDHAATIRRLAEEINAAVAAFIRGQGMICIILGIAYAVALSFAGIKYGVLIGLATGALSFVPYVGWALGLIAAATIAVIQSPQDWLPLAKVAGIFTIGMALDAAILSPKIVGERIGLHPVWLMFALFAFSYLFGFVGALVAVPVAAAIGVLVRYALELYLASSVFTGADRSSTGEPR